MGHWRNMSLLVLALSMAILHLSDSHCPPGNTPEDYVAVHNCIRKVLKMPPLEHCPELEALAKSWADQRPDCAMIHNDKRGETAIGWTGENMSSGYFLNITDGIQMWLDERLDYDYETNNCIQMCGHYTQIVWKDTTKVGCARSPCGEEGKRFVIVCNYHPPGNVVGQWPY